MDSSLSKPWRHFFLILVDPDLAVASEAGGVGGMKPGGWNAEVGAGPGDGAPPYIVPYLPGVGALGLPGLSGVLISTCLKGGFLEFDGDCDNSSMTSSSFSSSSPLSIASSLLFFLFFRGLSFY